MATNDELTIDNVQDALWDVRAKWKNIGSRIGIDDGTLEAVEVPGDHDKSFTKMMNHWLSGEYDPEEPKSKPRTWRTLIDVLKSRVVNAKKLATKLEMEKCPKDHFTKKLATKLEMEKCPKGSTASPQPPALQQQRQVHSSEVHDPSDFVPVDSSEVHDPSDSVPVDSSEVHNPSDSVQGLICGTEMCEDIPIVQHIQDDEKQFLPRHLLNLHDLDCLQFSGPLLEGKDVEIAVLDSGIHLHHEIFQSKGPDMIQGRSFVQGEDPEMTWFTKPELHGTAVSAVAAGNKYRSASGPCTGGIAPSAKLYICRVFSRKSFRWEWMIDALNHLINLKKESGDRIDIVVMSFGSKYSNSGVERKLKDLADLGVVIVAAGGNRGNKIDDADFPAKHNSVISVGALDLDGSVAEYTVTGCHIFAPGTSVLVPSVCNLQSLTDVCKQNGTSFAAPMLAGFLALLLQCAKESPPDVRRYIVEKYHDINFLNTLLRDDRFVRERKFEFASRVIQDLQNDPKGIVTLVQAHYPFN